VLRGFCSDCGTPLTYEAPDGIAIAAGAFDDPSALPPTVQFGPESRIAFVENLHTLPDIIDDLEALPFLKDLISYQHPDHDTKIWPPEKNP
jgi:hypothetical protein